MNWARKKKKQIHHSNWHVTELNWNFNSFSFNDTAFNSRILYIHVWCVYEWWYYYHHAKPYFSRLATYTRILKKSHSQKRFVYKNIFLLFSIWNGVDIYEYRRVKFAIIYIDRVRRTHIIQPADTLLLVVLFDKQVECIQDQ